MGSADQLDGDKRTVAAGPQDPENSLQSGYAPRSASPSISSALTPVNLLDPQRLALDDLEARRGKVDDFVASQLTWIPSKESLYKVLDGGQVDAVALAIDNIMRGGALITGDQTGMGKGRVAAAVLSWAHKQGHLPVFMTKNDTLYKAMTEDFADIGADFMVPFFTNVGLTIRDEEGSVLHRSAAADKQKAIIREIAESGKLPGTATVIFTTYDQLKGDQPSGFREEKKDAMRRKKNRIPRADGMRMAMFRALAPKMLFVLDESHMAAGDSDTGYRMMQLLMGWNIQNQPISGGGKPAGVYYSSATFAKRADNMPIYAMTDLGKAVNDPKNLPGIFVRGGVAMQQVVSAMLARGGQYIRREMDFSGITFGDKIVGEREEQWKQADQFTTPLRDIVDFSSHVQSIISEINGELHADGQTLDGVVVSDQLSGTEFADQLHNMVNQYLLAVKAKAVGEEAVAMLARGVKPVITVENTMEGPYRDTMDQGFEPNFRGLLNRYLANALVVTRTKMDGTKVKERINLDEHLASDNPAIRNLAARLKDEMETIADNIKATKLDELHISPIDTIREVIEEAGYKVGEITGRKTGVKRNGKTYTRPAVDTKATGKNRILSEFNNGGLDGLILNRSGSTGISAHNAPKFADKRPREMGVAQPNADISEMMQMYGRINRKGQRTLPQYLHFASQIAAELRVLSNLKRKLRGLKANTTSNTEGAEKTDVPELFNNYGDVSAYVVLERHPEIVEMLRHTFPGGTLPPRYSDDGTDQMRQGGDFFKRASGEVNVLPAEWQQKFYDEVDAEFTALVDYQTAIGENELIVENHDYKAVTTASELLAAESGPTEFESAANIETLRTMAGRPPVPLDEVKKIAADNRPVAQARAEAWRAAVEPARTLRIAEMEAKNGTKDFWPAQRQQINDRMDRDEAQINLAFNLLGKAVMVDVDGGSARGIVTDIKSDPAAPLTPSKQMVVVHINTSKQKTSFPASMVAQRITEIPMGQVDDRYVETSSTEQTRFVVTGNLISGFEALFSEQNVTAGKVITFTMADGTVRQGILLPQTYNPGRAMVPIKDSAHLRETLEHTTTVRNPSGLEIRKTAAPDTYEVRVPASRQRGGKFWREKAFTDLMRGGAMTTRGSDMVGSLPKTSLGEFYDLVTGMGEKLRFSAPPPRGSALSASKPSNLHAAAKQAGAVYQGHTPDLGLHAFKELSTGGNFSVRDADLSPAAIGAKADAVRQRFTPGALSASTPSQRQEQAGWPVEVALALLDPDTPVVASLDAARGFPDAEAIVVSDKDGVHWYDLTGEKPEVMATAKVTGDQAAIDALTDAEIPKVASLDDIDREDFPDADKALVIAPNVGRLDLYDENEDPIATARLVPGALNASTPTNRSAARVAGMPAGRSASGSDARAAAKAAAVGKQSGFATALARAKAAALSVGHYFTKLDKVTSYKKAKGEWLGAGEGPDGTGRQVASIEAKDLRRHIIRQFPNKLSRMAISRYIEADGDQAELRRQAGASTGALKAVYERAAALTPEEVSMAQEAKSFFDDIGAEAVRTGVLGDMIENYVTHFVDRSSIPQAQRATVVAGIVNNATGGKLNPNFAQARHRVMQSMFELEQKGYRLQTSDVADIMPAYSQSLSNTISARGFIRSLTTLDAEDGRPLAVTSGSAKIMPGAGAPALMVKPFTKPEEAADYRSVDHSALRKWRWAIRQPDGSEVFLEGELLVHPSIYQDLKNTLGTSALNKNAVVRAVTALQVEAKGLMMGWSLFHYVQEGTHAIGHGVNPFKFHPVDVNDPVVRELMNGGLMVSMWDAKNVFGEGLVGSGIVNRIPLLGPVNQYLSELLFEDYIPGLKVEMAKHALERNLRRYARELRAGTITRADVVQKTARQANDAFGEQNNMYEGNNPTRLHAERLLLLAPDFLKSRAHFFADIGRKYGREQLRAVFILAVVMAVTAKLIERMLTGTNHWEKPFAVVTKHREYELRSVPGDVLELLHDPRRWISGRISPLISRTTLEALTQRDYRGRKRSLGEQLMDLVKTPIPITARGLVDKDAPELSPLEQAGSGLGFRARRQSQITNTRILGHEWKKKMGLETGDEVYPESKYLHLRQALEDGNMEKARTVYKELQKGAPKSKVDKGFYESLMKPFSGAEKTEAKFRASLTGNDAQTYVAGLAERQRVKLLFTALSGYHPGDTRGATFGAPTVPAPRAPSASTLRFKGFGQN